MDESPLQEMVGGLLSGDRRVQRRIVDTMVAEDVAFSHILGTLRGREAFYGIYRLATLAWRYKVTWIEYIRAGNKVVLQLDLGIKVPPFYIWRYHFPTVVLLRFEDGPDGRLLLKEQVDHHSMLAAMYLLGWPFTALSDRVVRPLTGLLFSRLGTALDSLSAAAEAAGAALRAAVAAVLQEDASSPTAGWPRPEFDGAAPGGGKGGGGPVVKAE